MLSRPTRRVTVIAGIALAAAAVGGGSAWAAVHRTSAPSPSSSTVTKDSDNVQEGDQSGSDAGTETVDPAGE